MLHIPSLFQLSLLIYNPSMTNSFACIKCTATKNNTGKRTTGGKRRSEEELKKIVSNAREDMEGEEEEELVDGSLYKLTPVEKNSSKKQHVVIHRASLVATRKALGLIQKKEVEAKLNLCERNNEDLMKINKLRNEAAKLTTNQLTKEEIVKSCESLEARIHAREREHGMNMKKMAKEIGGDHLVGGYGFPSDLEEEYKEVLGSWGNDLLEGVRAKKATVASATEE